MRVARGCLLAWRRLLPLTCPPSCRHLPATPAGASLERLHAAYHAHAAAGGGSPLLVDGCPLEELCLTFELPGYPGHALHPDGAEVGRGCVCVVWLAGRGPGAHLADAWAGCALLRHTPVPRPAPASLRVLSPWPAHAPRPRPALAPAPALLSPPPAPELPAPPSPLPRLPPRPPPAPSSSLPRRCPSPPPTCASTWTRWWMPRWGRVWPAQVAAFRAGFDAIFPISSLAAFYEDEIEVMLCGEQQRVGSSKGEAAQGRGLWWRRVRARVGDGGACWLLLAAWPPLPSGRSAGVRAAGQPGRSSPAHPATLPPQPVPTLTHPPSTPPRPAGTVERWSVEYLAEVLKFDHGYTAQSPPVRFLLEVLAGLDGVEQRRFLRFVTGSPRLPPGGLAALQPRLTVVRKLSHSASGVLGAGVEGSSAPLGSMQLSGPSVGASSAPGGGRHPADGDLPSGARAGGASACGATCASLGLPSGPPRLLGASCPPTPTPTLPRVCVPTHPPTHARSDDVRQLHQAAALLLPVRAAGAPACLPSARGRAPLTSRECVREGSVWNNGKNSMRCIQHSTARQPVHEPRTVTVALPSNRVCRDRQRDVTVCGAAMRGLEWGHCSQLPFAQWGGRQTVETTPPRVPVVLTTGGLGSRMAMEENTMGRQCMESNEARGSRHYSGIANTTVRAW